MTRIRIAAALALALGAATLRAEPGSLIAVYPDIKNGKAWAREWKDGRAHREAHGVTAWSLMQDPRDAQRVWVFFQSEDLSRTAAALRERWSEVQLWVAKDLEPKKLGSPKKNGGAKRARGRHHAGMVVVRHRVHDVAAWRERFNANTHRHAKRGYEPSRRSLHQDAADPQTLYVTHDASDIDAAIAYMGRPEMLANMRAAGVEGEPVFLFGRWVESGGGPKP